MDKYIITFSAMASRCEIRLCADSDIKLEAVAQKAIEEVKRIEFKYSRYRADSLLSTINQRAGTGEWTVCDEETLALLNYAEALYQTSGGLFDITSGVLRQTWDFKKAQLPDAECLARCLAKIGWSKVERSGERIRLPEAGMEIDFGGFGKEYAVDRAVDIVSQWGIKQGLVNLGGDIAAVGRTSMSEPWQMAIQHPRCAEKMMAHIPLYEGALATSGDYERFFDYEGQRYCHILNPQTGWPVRSWQSISVIAPKAIIAGGCATIAMLKEEGAPAFLEQCGMPYLLVDQEGQLQRGQGLKS
jgi:FAD:protein FMN transferase